MISRAQSVPRQRSGRSVRSGRIGDFRSRSNYQLIRGVLAASAMGGSFCVLCDVRRPDLIERWYSVMRAVKNCVLRCRLQLLTWQELAGVMRTSLRKFLALKYGITPAKT
jgi:hypothetical protein